MLFLVLLDRLLMANRAIDKHDQRGPKVEEVQGPLALLARIADRLIGSDKWKADQAKYEEDTGDPEVSVLIPNGFGQRLLLTHLY